MAIGAFLVAMPVRASDPIIGGTKTATCGWPSVVRVLDGREQCSGTLIHPKVVMTAAHCLTGGPTTVGFGETGSQLKRSATCRGGASGETGVGTRNDWAYCVLDEEVTGVPIVPPISGCEMQRYLKAGANLTAVGFGLQSTAGPVGTKFEVQVPLVSGPTAGVITVGRVGQGLCQGDSGGPVFLHIVDGGVDYGWRVVGSTSGGAGANAASSCPGVATFVTSDQHVKQIEATGMYDVTPCLGSDGMWSAGPECKDFQIDPALGGGSWPACGVGDTIAGTIPNSCSPGANDGGGGGGSVDGGRDDASTGSAGAAGREGGVDGGGGTTATGRDGGGGASSSGTGGGGGATGGGSTSAGAAGSVITSAATTGTTTTGTAGKGGAGSGGNATGGSGGTRTRAPLSAQSDEGCGCRSAGGAKDPFGFFLAAFAIWLVRRRSSRVPVDPS
jgi:MYXO-CTERM domain-containing protein